MKIRLRLLILLMTFEFGISLTYAQQPVTLYVPVKDAVSNRTFDFENYSYGFDICNPSDSSVITRSKLIVDDQAVAIVKFIKDEYILKVYVEPKSETAIEYEPKWINIKKNEIIDGTIRVQPVYLSRKRSIKLNEVSAVATKIKFYHKGDTLIYNADAFILAEGSKLESLIEQLPGVTLHRNGVIYCNGVRVQELLLNGKDLFNGNKELMLENLGAYTVKDIAVYRKNGKLSELFEENMNDSRYTMDVRLKREYLHGFILNSEAGYGTHNRYLAKLFGMWFSDNVSMTFYGGLNNLSDELVPGKDETSWSRDRMGNGVQTRHYAGTTYLAEGTGWEIKGNIDVTRSIIDEQSTTENQNFIDDTVDTYGYTVSSLLKRSYRLDTKHSLFYRFGKVANFFLTPKVRYENSTFENNYVSAVLTSRLDSISRDRLEDLYFNGLKNTNITLLNRSINQSYMSGHTLNGGITAQSDIRLPFTKPTQLHLLASAEINRKHSDEHNYYGVRYSSGESVYDENRHFKNYPDIAYNYSVSTEFKRNWQLNKLTLPLSLSYVFSHTRDTKTSDIYIKDNDLEIFSPLNSYHSFLRSHFHGPSLQILAARFSSNGIKNIFSVSGSLRQISRNYDYNGRGINELIKRNDVVINGSLDWSIGFPSYYNFSFGMNTTEKLAEMFQIVPANNSTDVLNTYSGNPNLKNPRLNNLYIELSRNMPNSHHSHRLNLKGQMINDDIIYGFIYNPETGVRNFQYMNVAGNWNTETKYEYSLTPKNRLSLRSETKGNFARNTDMIGVASSPLKRHIFLLRINEKLKLEWQQGMCRFAITGDIQMNRYFSHNNSFENFFSWVWSTGASTQLKLPRNWDLGTDVTLYGRKGFLDRRLNTGEAVWNARVSKSILKGNLTFALDAYDILHQLNNVTYTVNASARTEIVSNAIPSYLLFHILYRFSVNPSRK